MMGSRSMRDHSMVRKAIWEDDYFNVLQNIPVTKIVINDYKLKMGKKISSVEKIFKELNLLKVGLNQDSTKFIILSSVFLKRIFYTIFLLSQQI